MMRNASTGCAALAIAAVTGCMPMGAPGEAPAETARLRVVHASPDAPAVDICANGAAAFSDVAYPSATDHATVDEGTYQTRVVPVGGGCDDGGVINATLTLPPDTDTTVVALNTLDAIEPLVLEDDNSSPAMGMFKVRFVHASPDAPTVDVTLAEGTTLFNDTSFKEVGSYIEVPPGTVDLQVRNQAGTAVVLTIEDVSLEAGTAYTVYAIGLLAGEPAPDALITVDN